jgi:hypothetical protein
LGSHPPGTRKFLCSAGGGGGDRGGGGGDTSAAARGRTLKRNPLPLSPADATPRSNVCAINLTGPGHNACAAFMSPSVAQNRDAELARAYATVHQAECTATATIEKVEAAPAPAARSVAQMRRLLRPTITSRLLPPDAGTSRAGRRRLYLRRLLGSKPITAPQCASHSTQPAELATCLPLTGPATRRRTRARRTQSRATHIHPSASSTEPRLCARCVSRWWCAAAWTRPPAIPRLRGQRLGLRVCLPTRRRPARGRGIDGSVRTTARADAAPRPYSQAARRKPPSSTATAASTAARRWRARSFGS